MILLAGGAAAGLTALGSGPAVWLLRGRSGWWAAAPALGFALFAILGSWLSIWLPMRVAVWPLLALALLSLGWALRSAARASLQPYDGRGAWQPAVVGVLALALLFALVPAFGRPELVAIGPNWDTEVYLPLAAALTDAPNGFTLAQPAGVPFPGYPNPLLWRINFFDPRSGGLAFSLLQAAGCALSGLGVEQTFIPTLAALYALAVPGFWWLLGNFTPWLPSRKGGKSNGEGTAAPGLAALAVTGALAFNAAGAFVLFFAFGQQVAAAVLTAPLARAALTDFVDNDRRRLLFGSLVLAGLLVTYSPALTLAGAVLAGAAVGSALERRSLRPLLRCAIQAGIAAALVPFAIVRLVARAGYLQTEGGVGGLTTGPGVERFPPLAWGLGLLPGPGVAQNWDITAVLPWMIPSVSIGLTLLVGLAAVAGLWLLQRRGAWGVIGMLAAVAALLLALRVALPYPYGYFKLLPSAAPFLLFLPAVGLSGAVRWAHPSWEKKVHPGKGLAGPPTDIPVPVSTGRQSDPPLRAVGRLFVSGAVLPAACLVLAVIIVNGLVAAQTARASSRHTYAAGAALTERVPAGERVCVSGGPGLEGPEAGGAAFFLRHADLYGEFQTGYSTFFRPPPDQGCQWWLQPQGSSPPPVVVEPRPVWEALGWRLWRRNNQVLAGLEPARLVSPPHIEYGAEPGGRARGPITGWNPDGSPEVSAWSPPLVGVLAPSSGAAWHWLSPADDQLTLVDDGGRLRLSSDAEGTETEPRLVRPPLHLVLVLAVFPEAGSLELISGTSARTIEVSQGITVLDAGSDLGVPLTLRSTNPGVRLAAAYLVNGAPADPMVGPVIGVQPLTSEAEPDGANMQLWLDGSAGNGDAVLDVYREDGAAHYGYWVLGKGRLPGALTLNLAQQQITARSGQPLPHEAFPAPDGRYRALLQRFSNGTPEHSLPLFSFTLAAGTITDFQLEARGDRLW